MMPYDSLECKMHSGPELAFFMRQGSKPLLQMAPGVIFPRNYLVPESAQSRG